MLRGANTCIYKAVYWLCAQPSENRQLLFSSLHLQCSKLKCHQSKQTVASADSTDQRDHRQDDQDAMNLLHALEIGLWCG